MPTNVIMPALEMAQENGKVIRWLVTPGTRVEKGQPIVEIETDRSTVEIEAPDSGVLNNVTAREGDIVPVGRTIAVIGEGAAAAAPAAPAPVAPAPQSARDRVKASPLARKIAEQHGVDIAQVRTSSGKIEKADVLAHVSSRAGRVLASPKARRLASERGVDLKVVRGSGPDGAVIAADLPAAAAREGAAIGTVWRVMAERMTQSWTTAPHFYLVREVNASRLMAWRARMPRGVTYTDLLVRLVSAALASHPRARVSGKDGALLQHDEGNIGVAVAIDDGLVVPVIHRADTLSLAEIAARREELVTRAQSGKLRMPDITGGVFTISNLGMYGVDAFNAIVNPPQAAILAVGRIADRVVPIDGAPAVAPMMVLTLSCDHRAIDGARGAQFLGALADLVEEPLALLT